jgi:hypothetical protein
MRGWGLDVRRVVAFDPDQGARPLDSLDTSPGRLLTVLYVQSGSIGKPVLSTGKSDLEPDLSLLLLLPPPSNSPPGSNRALLHFNRPPYIFPVAYSLRLHLFDAAFSDQQQQQEDNSVCQPRISTLPPSLPPPTPPPHPPQPELGACHRRNPVANFIRSGSCLGSLFRYVSALVAVVTRGLCICLSREPDLTLCHLTAGKDRSPRLTSPHLTQPHESLINVTPITPATIHFGLSTPQIWPMSNKDDLDH